MTRTLAPIHFLARAHGDGVLCSNDRAGGSALGAEVTCSNCITTMRRLAKDWVVGPATTVPGNSLRARVEGTMMVAPNRRGAEDVCRILGLYWGRVTHLDDGYHIKLDAQAVRARDLLLAECARTNLEVLPCPHQA